MATHNMISASIVEWKVVGSQAVYEKASPVSATVPEGPDDRVKQRLLAEWLKGKDAKEIPALLDKMGQGLVTVEVTARTPITPPSVETGQTPEATLVEALRQAFPKKP